MLSLLRTFGCQYLSDSTKAKVRKKVRRTFYPSPNRQVASISGLREDQVHLDHPHGVLRVKSAAAAGDRVGREGPGEQNQRSVLNCCFLFK